MSPELPARLRRAGTWTVVSLGFLLLGACAADDRDQIQRLGLPEPATDRGPEIAELWKWAWVAAGVTGLVTFALILWVAFHYRRRDDRIPVQTRYNLPIEIFYTIAPIIMVLVFFFFTVESQNRVLADVPDADHEINVIGQKWSWTFNYLEEDAVDGDSVYMVGTPGDLPTLVLPVDETVTVNLSSPDVIHSFWVPAFLFKLDVIPGRENSFSFTPEREGTYVGKCAELCGAYHSRMLFELEVVSVDEYEGHLQELKDAGNVGTPKGASDAGDQAGLDVRQNEEVQEGQAE